MKGVKLSAVSGSAFKRDWGNIGLGTKKGISDGLFSNGDLGGGPVGAQGRGLRTGNFIHVE